jgi:hypothetical protein
LALFELESGSDMAPVMMYVVMCVMRGWLMLLRREWEVKKDGTVENQAANS